MPTVPLTPIKKLQSWWYNLPMGQKNTGLFGGYGLLVGAVMMYVLEGLFPRKISV